MRGTHHCCILRQCCRTEHIMSPQYNVPHCSQPHPSLPPTAFFFRNFKGKGQWGVGSLSRSSAAYPCPELHTYLPRSKTPPKRVICKKGPWSIIFTSPTDLPSSSVNVSRRDNKNEDIIMAISNHQAASNSPKSNPTSLPSHTLSQTISQ